VRRFFFCQESKIHMNWSYHLGFNLAIGGALCAAWISGTDQVRFMWEATDGETKDVTPPWEPNIEGRAWTDAGANVVERWL
jgi:hypothetical protein